MEVGFTSGRSAQTAMQWLGWGFIRLITTGKGSKLALVPRISRIFHRVHQPKV